MQMFYLFIFNPSIVYHNSIKTMVGNSEGIVGSIFFVGFVLLYIILPPQASVFRNRNLQFGQLCCG